MEVIKVIVGIIIPTATAFLAYYFTKNKEREAELRKEKLEHYKNFMLCLTGILEGESSDEA